MHAAHPIKTDIEYKIARDVAENIQQRKKG